MASETSPLTTSGPPTRGAPQRTKRLAIGLVLAAIAVVGGIAIFKPSSTHSSNNQVQTTSGTTPSIRSSAVRVSDPASTPTFPGQDDLIAGLPGKPPAYTSRLFSGEVPLSNGAQGFYFFAESQSTTPHTDPLLLWLNGGPGASSLEGCFTENGPLLVQPGGKTLRVNEHAWNQQVNMLCIESPIGVGFTYNASGIYKSDDVAQADDLYEMLQAFLDKFPWLRPNDFIITGESYGGIYVPMTAKRIVEGNALFVVNATQINRVINLKKFAVGNGVNDFGDLSVIAFAYYHGLVGTETYMNVAAVCPELSTPGKRLPANASSACLEAIGTFHEQIAEASVNPYGIYNTCDNDGAFDIAEFEAMLLGPMQPVPRPLPLISPPCISLRDPAKYFNLPEVRAAMHTLKEVHQWSNALTSGNIDLHMLLPNATADELDAIIKNKVLDYTSTQNTVTPVWKYLLDNGIEGVIYHGDTDMMCDFLGGLWTVEAMQLPRKNKRAGWTVDAKDSQVAGFVEDFGSLKYVTVKGAGHMVPTDKPREAKAMLDQFILN